MTDRPTTSCAALLVPVGPSEANVTGMADLIQSVRFHEPQAIDQYLLLDDTPVERNLPGVSNVDSRMAVLRSVHNRAVNGAWGGLCTGVLQGLRWIHEHTTVQWVLKMDTDALAIAPFAGMVSRFFADNPDAGLIGCLGETANRSEHLFQWCLQRRPRLAIAMDAVRQLTPDRFAAGGDAVVRVAGADQSINVSEREFYAFQRIKPHVELALTNGMTAAEYCQGGAYAMSREMIRRMAAMGFFDSAEAWSGLPFGEDEAVAMYCRAVNLKIYDFSDRGEPFGIRYRDLPYGPSELIARGHALIHSLRSERYGPECAIRQFYADRRVEAPAI